MSTTITTEANLTADPELRYTKSSKAVCSIRLAISSRRKNADGEYEDTPAVFAEATAWGPLAENAADSLHKGDRVLVHGASYDEEWTDREGQTRIKHVIQVESIGASLRYTTVQLARASRANQRAETTNGEGAEVIELT
jgi:single-strand DNA-binding protein